MNLPSLRFVVFLVFVMMASLLVVVPAASAAEPVRVAITAVDPDAQATLAFEDKLYLQVSYESDVPLRFQALGMFDDAVLEVGAIKNNGLLHASGEGQALAWVMYLNTTHVNAVKLIVLDEQWRQVMQITKPVNVHWKAEGYAESRQLAAWIGPLNRAEERLADFHYDPAPRKYGTLYDIFFYINLAAIPIYILMQLHMLWRYNYRWRELAAIPLFPYMIVGFYILFGLNIETSLQITFLFRYTFFALLWLILVWVAKRFWQHKLPPPKLYKPPKA